MAAGAGAVWVSDSDRASVFRINPVTREQLEIRVGGIPERIALLDGSVWVVVRVD